MTLSYVLSIISIFISPLTDISLNWNESIFLFKHCRTVQFEYHISLQLNWAREPYKHIILGCIHVAYSSALCHLWKGSAVFSAEENGKSDG